VPTTTVPKSQPQIGQSLSLPQYPARPVPVAAPPPDATPSGSEARRCQSPDHRFAGDPFSPCKIFNHVATLQALARGETVAPITVEIDPTNVCNHRCQWCVSSQSHNGGELTLDVFKRLVDGLRRLGSKSVVLKGGGEPTLHKQFNAMSQAVADAGLALGVITNGTLPWPDTPRILLETADWVRISVDAARAQTHGVIHGSRDFDRIIRHVTCLTKNTRRTLVGLNFVAEPRNYTEIVDFARLGKSLGVAYVWFRCVFDPTMRLDDPVLREMRRQTSAAQSLADDNFRVLSSDFDGADGPAPTNRSFPYRQCLGPNLIGIVGGDGEVYACCFLRGYPEFSLGNVNHEDFQQIWQGARRRAVMQRVRRGECGRVCVGDNGLTFLRYHQYNAILDYLTLEHKAHSDFA
jgi:MoaA/NifB/PqqE/SkfB family radical SAM enzyme